MAVDAATGKELWNTKVGEINLGESLTMAPLIVKGKVIIGNSGGEIGIRGWVTALDLASGKIVWRAYHTGPDSREDRSALQAVLRRGPEAGPRREDLAGRFLEDRRRRNVGMDLLRSRSSTSFTTARRTRVRGIPIKDRGTTSGARRCSLATPIRAKRCGLIR